MASRLWASRVASQLRISVFNRGFASVVKDFKYANSHEWVKVDGKSATVGITDHAQDHLGDVVYVELPEVGVAVTQGGSFGAVESVKATSDIYSPVSGPPFDKKLFVAYIKKYIKLLTPKLEGDKQEECKKKMQRVGRDDANEGIKKVCVEVQRAAKARLPPAGEAEVLSVHCFLIARRLLGKILIDLRNTREEAISVAELKSSQDQSTKTGKEEVEYQLKPHSKNEDGRRASFTSDISMDQDDDDEKETKYRLDPKYANVKTPERHVRTRLYFTSVSKCS
ncbi:hypothetical protein HYC85_002990 [Camellia sinensis]|uniref:Lipoyl-binding domain-containing protein n=1 Tax=Camellia sinensis TaxID=4442 RepID=A0A7J7IB35_CAMSI|nr:hypothetical protein HYC85_002990 [Camellia sinensis]